MLALIKMPLVRNHGLLISLELFVSQKGLDFGRGKIHYSGAEKNLLFTVFSLRDINNFILQGRKLTM